MKRAPNPFSLNLETADADLTPPTPVRDLGANDSVEEIKLSAATRTDDKIIMINNVVFLLLELLLNGV